ncbi:MAG TPA: 3-hydroxyacyl-ACP dehydratase FabZ [Candidatus Acidoferrales bacterium]|nr:3-hydroxyacyl-ACP dehydratase FabZ [Candidatus Acidoferrales bacterium]
MDVPQIQALLPHRYPFLLLDRVVALEPGRWLEALKNVTINEPFFQGHFPGRPVMPGVLILEAMAQATGILAYRSAPTPPDPAELYYLVGIDRARFKKPVVPGDQLQIHVALMRTLKQIWRFETRAEVDGVCVAEAQIMCAARRYDRD